MKRFIDITGEVFGRLSVVCRAANSRLGQTMWNCICICGNKKIINGSALRTGVTKSCGCFHHERLIAGSTTHGQYHTRRYKMLYSAKNRARNYKLPFNLTLEDIPEIPEKCPVLGISLAREKEGYSKDDSPSLDRIRPNLGYVKGNIRIISQRANQIKSNSTPEELLLMAKDAMQWLRDEGVIL